MHGAASSVGDAKQDKFKSWAIPFISGGIAGTVAKTAIAPLERVKIMYDLFYYSHKRYQVNHARYREHTSVTKKLVAVHQNEGKKGLFRGNAATVARIFPYAAIQ
jgi:solute carrier family 25 protein 16